jgi:hypothetical protein
MRKKFIPVLFIILLLLPFSCSELILPKNVDVHGTLDLAIKVMADNWGHAVAKALKKALIKNSDKIDMIDFEAEIYDVNYGQTEQTFLISIRSEITNHLNPSEYLKEAGAYLYLLNTENKFKISYEIDMDDMKEKEVSFNKHIYTVPAYLGGIPVAISIPPTKLNLTDTNFDLEVDGFLHALIEDGEIQITVDLLKDGDPLGDGIIDIQYNLNIDQANNPYAHVGLSCSSDNSNTVILTGEHINNQTVTLSGWVQIESGPSLVLTPGELEARVTIKVIIRELHEVDWKFSDIADYLNGHQIEPISLTEVAKYVNYIVYEEESIGLKFKFDNMIDGLEMSLKSNAMGIDSGFKNLTADDDEIMFANNNAGTLRLADGTLPASVPAPFTSTAVSSFDFALALRPKGNSDILHIEPDGGISTTEPLKIEGTAEFFQDWKQAQLNMENIIKAAPNATGSYMKRIPGEKEDPIDLSMLTDYITGFNFGGIKSEMHLNGPDGIVTGLHVDEDPEISLLAKYWWDDPAQARDEPIIAEGTTLRLDEDTVSLNAGDFDINGSYNKSTLPPNGKPFSFSGILNNQAKKLVFTSQIKLPDTITITRDLFEGKSDTVDTKITVTILIMLPLKLTVLGDGPGLIKFPDMFDGAKDLFGRSNLEEDSVFNSQDMNIEYLKFAIDFTDAFFNGGKVFLEKEGNEKLFPNGINLDGKKIVLDVYGADFETIKNNLIDPDLRLIFPNPDSSLNVPRNIGLSNIKVEAKGKFGF